MDILAVNQPETPPSLQVPDKRWAGWLTRIEGRKKVFEDGWWKAAQSAERMYDIQKTENTGDANPFNVLYANTEVLLPALYSNTPRPDVATRNQAGRQEIAKATEAFLTSFIDMNSPGRESFDDAMEMATLSALVPGSGFVRLRAYPGESCPLRAESGNYQELIWAKSRSWSKVPWIAFVHTMTKEDIVKQFELGPEQASLLGSVTQEERDKSSSDEKGPNSPSYVYELWIKETREIVFLCKDYRPILLQQSQDDLKLTSFYPTPGPLRLVVKTGSLDPTPLYQYYKNQAEELNRVTVRLNKVLSAIRVRGAYNPLLGDDIKNILGDDKENGLVAAQNPMGLEGKGFEGHIWMMPLEKLIQVAKELYTARVQIMGVIQQITGLSDIVRGSTVASETATAQDLKNKWGTIRLQRMQKLVAKYVRDLLRMAINAGANVLDEATWKALSQLPIPTSQEKQAAQVYLQHLQQQAAVMQQTVLPGAPPAQVQPPPPEMVAAAQSPVTWLDIINSLKDDNSRTYIIDVETNSTVTPDATADKEEVGDFMVAMGQMLAGLAPLAQIGPSGMEVAKELLIAVTSKFKFGREVKESLQKLQIPPPGQGQPSPEDQAKAAQAKIDLQVAQEEAANKMAILANQKQLAQAQFLSDQEEIQLKRAQTAAAHELLNLKVEGARVKLASTKVQAAAKPPAPQKKAN